MVSRAGMAFLAREVVPAIPGIQNSDRPEVFNGMRDVTGGAVVVKRGVRIRQRAVCVPVGHPCGGENVHPDPDTNRHESKSRQKVLPTTNSVRRTEISALPNVAV